MMMMTMMMMTMMATLPTRRVPDLQLHRLLVDGDGAEAEVDADRADVRVCEVVVREAQEEAGLADARVADQHQLEEVVANNSGNSSSGGGGSSGGGSSSGSGGSGSS
jgi:hypothetical protein